jgi:hypothetical protein
MKIFYFLLLCIILISSVPLFSQGEAGALASFKVIVKSVDDFFSTSPIILVTEDFPSSPSGKINYRIKFEKFEISYDIQKTTSLVSPYTAYIDLKLKASSNASKGDIADSYGGAQCWGFQSAADAIKNQDFLTCTGIPLYSTPEETGIARCTGSVKLLYSFQDNAWVFKNASLPDDSSIQDRHTAIILRFNFLENPKWKQVLLGKNK